MSTIDELRSNRIDSSYVIEMRRNSIEEIISYLKNYLHTHDVIVEVEKNDKDKTLLVLSCTRNTIEQLAHRKGLMKRKLDDTYQCYSNDSKITFKNYESSDFFDACEEMELLMELLVNIPTSKEFYEFKSIEIKDKSIERPLLTSLKLAYITNGNCIPLHGSGRLRTWKQLKFKLVLSWNDIGIIQSYYGNKIALYFGWMLHFTQWLVAPAFLGLLLTLYDVWYPDVSMENSMIAPIFAIFMVFWGAFFIRFWERKSATLCCNWGTTDFYSSGSPEQMMHAYTNTIKHSKFSIISADDWQSLVRMGKYFISSSITSLMLLLALIVMILSLNFQGYIHSNTLFGAYIHFPIIHQFSMPGAIFDQQGGGPWPYILPFIPCGIHSLTILMLNKYYRSIAIQLTVWENHRLESEFQDALIVKRFCFEAFDCYVALFYLAFCQIDLILLRTELVSLYTIDSLRRVTTESILPLIMQKVEKKQMNKHSRVKKDDDENQMNEYNTLIVDQMHLEVYDQFDDYMEMVIQFGYILLFASAFPLAAFLSIFCNIVEMKSDLFKLTFVTQRPPIESSRNIGRWISVLRVLVYMSVLTNVFIFGFTSGQMMQYLPMMFQEVPSLDVKFGGVDHTHQAVLGMGRWVVGIVFLVEHVVLLGVKAVFNGISNTPQHVKSELKRRNEAWHQLMQKRST